MEGEALHYSKVEASLIGVGQRTARSLKQRSGPSGLVCGAHAPSGGGVHPARQELFVNKEEIALLQKYLRDKFRLDTISLHARVNKDDSAEVHIGDEFVGVIFKDEEDGELSYQFQMCILDLDLPGAA
jgi:hypothetical protein